MLECIMSEGKNLDDSFCESGTTVTDEGQCPQALVHYAITRQAQVSWRYAIESVPSGLPLLRY